MEKIAQAQKHDSLSLRRAVLVQSGHPNSARPPVSTSSVNRSHEWRWCVAHVSVLPMQTTRLWQPTLKRDVNGPLSQYYLFSFAAFATFARGLNDSAQS